jgi:hypothetical protein
MLAPFEDPEWEIWVLGNQLDQYKGRRITRVFEIHDYLEDKPEGYAKWLIDQDLPLVVSDQFPEKAEIYPYEEAKKLLGDYFSSSPAYMMAYAILKGATHIGIYGIDMAVDDHEYFKQRPDMYAWIAYAKAKGIEIFIPEESGLFKSGYNEGREWGKGAGTGSFSESQLLDMVYLHERKIAEYKAELEQINAMIQSHDGARQAYQRMAKIARASQAGIEVKSLTDTYTN